MGKQLNLYLDDQESKRLIEEAAKECRRPHEQVRFILRQALGIIEQPQEATASLPKEAVPA